MAKRITSRYSKVTLLLLVYFLHIMLLQALMAGPVNNKIDQNFKPLFTYKHSVPPGHTPNHPAVSYYSMLVKQGIIGLRSSIDVVVPFSSVGAFFDVNTTLLTESGYKQMPCIACNLGDDNFKLYQAFHSFLI